MEKSGVLLTDTPALMPMRSHAVKLRRLTRGAHSVPAAMDRGTPAEGTIRATLRGRARLDRILPVRVHTVGVLRTRAAAEGRPARPPAAPAGEEALARRVRAAREEARAAGPSEPLHLAI